MCEVLEKKEVNSTGIIRADSVLSKNSYYEYISKLPENIESESLHRKQFIWLGNAYFSCPCDRQRMILDTSYDSDALEIQRYSASFKLRMTKYSPVDIRVELHREFKQYHETDEMYFLRIFFEIENTLCLGKFTDMPFHLNEVSVDFSWRTLCTPSKPNYVTIVKCGFWMYELIPLETEISLLAERCLYVYFQEHQSSVPAIYDDMTYLIGSAEMSGFFSGRNGEDFLKEKLLLLTRTVLFSNALARRKKCSENDQPLDKSTPIDLILGYISNGIVHYIEKDECIDLYKMSFVYGLPFLQDECEEFMASYMANDGDFIVNVIALTYTFERWAILDKALSYFFEYKDVVLKCDRWKSLHSTDSFEVLFIQTLVKRSERMLSKKDVPAEKENSMQQDKPGTSRFTE